MTADTLTVTEAHCGPSRTGNGGYVAGLLATHYDGPLTVRLVKGVPLDIPLKLERDGDEICLCNGPTLIAMAHPAELELEIPPPPTFAEAEEAARAFLGKQRHAFPNCFVCGPERGPEEGLRIFPGAVASRNLVAAPWVPHAALADAQGRVPPEVIWATLECTGGFALYPRLVLMGELTGRVDGTVQSGEKCVSAGWSLGHEGRKFYVGSALYGEDGRTVAAGYATWIEMPKERFITLMRTGYSS